MPDGNRVFLIFPNFMPFCVFFSYDRNIRKHVKEHFYAVGAMRKECLNPEDDVALSLGLDSLFSVHFFTRLQAGDKVLHSWMFKRVSKR